MVQTPLNRSSSKRERQNDHVGAAATCAFLKSVFGTCPVSFYRSRLDALLAASGLLKTLFVPPKQVSSAASDGAVAPSSQPQRSEQTTPSQKIDRKKLFHAFAHQLLEVVRSLCAAYSDEKSSANETVTAHIARPQLLESLVARLETLDAQWDAATESSPTPEKKLLSLVDCAHLLIKA